MRWFSRARWLDWLVPVGLALAATAFFVAASVQLPAGMLSIGGLAATTLFAILPALVAIAGQTLANRVGLPLARATPRINIFAAGVAVLTGVAVTILNYFAILVEWGQLNYTGLLNLSVYEGLNPRYTESWLLESLGIAIFEEIVFRAVLLSVILWIALRLRLPRTSAIVAALVLSSALFGSAHLGTPLNVLFHTADGIAFGLIFCWRGLWASSVAHATVDAGIFIWARVVAPLFV